VADDDLMDLDDQGTSDEGNAPKVLRQQNAKLAKDNAAMKAQLDSLMAANRARDIEDLLVDAKVDRAKAKKIGQYVKVEGDVTQEKIQAWIASEGDTFGIVVDEGLTPEQEARADAGRRIATTTASAPEGTPRHVLDSAGIRALSDEDAKRLGIIPPDTTRASRR
jgi:hypothetical protein